MEIPQEENKTVVAAAVKTETAVSIAISKYNIDANNAVALREFFEPLERQANEWSEKAFQLVITDASQTEEIKQAKEGRLAVRQIRLAIEKLHKEKKDGALREGQMLDLIKRVLIGLVEPIETHLKKQEDFVELQERNRVNDLYKSRLEELAPYRVPGDNIDVLALGEMSEIVFNGIKTGVITAHQQREKEKADLERQAKDKEEAERKERERMAAENARLKVKNQRVTHLMSLGFYWSEEHRSFIRGPKDKHAMNVGALELEEWDVQKFSEVVTKFRQLIDADIKEDEAEQKRVTELAKKEKEKQELYTQRVQSLTTLGFVWNESNKSYEHPGIVDDEKIIRHAISDDALKSHSDVDFSEWFDFVSVKIATHNQEQEKFRQRQANAAKELQERQERERLEAKQRALDEKKKQRAPDKEKLLSLAEAIKNIEQPQLKDDQAKDILLNVQNLLAKVNKYITEQCANL